jgi:hypothetical protein
VDEIIDGDFDFPSRAATTMVPPPTVTPGVVCTGEEEAMGSVGEVVEGGICSFSPGARKNATTKARTITTTAPISSF